MTTMLRDAVILVGSLDRYLICSDGSIFSLRSHKWLGGGMGTNGRPFVILVFGAGETRLLYRHKLVAETFLGPVPDGLEVSHLDNDVMNNDINNLKYETHSENLARRKANGTMDDGFNNSRAVLKPGDPEKIRELREEGLSHQKIARRFNVSRTTISRVLNGQRYGGEAQ